MVKAITQTVNLAEASTLKDATGNAGPKARRPHSTGQQKTNTLNFKTLKWR